MGALSRGHTRRTLEQLVPKGIPTDSSPLGAPLWSLPPRPFCHEPPIWSFEAVSDTQVVIKGDTGRFPDLGICLANAMVTARQLAGKATVSRLSEGTYGVTW